MRKIPLAISANTEHDVLVLSGTRTAIGKYGGGLKDVPPCDLAATVVREAVRRAGVRPADVGHVVFGNVIHTEAQDMYLAPGRGHQRRPAGRDAAFTLNRLCGSGLQAIVSAAQAIMLGDADVAVAGGAEIDEPRPVLGARPCAGASGWATAPRSTSMVGALTDPFDACHMGVTAENVAEDFGVSARTRTRWPSRATAARPPPSTAGTSRTRSCRCRSRSRAQGHGRRSTRRARPRRARRKTWPGSGPRSPKTAP